MKIFLLLNMTKGHPFRWPLLKKKAPRTGFEPVTYRLTAGRSTVELSRKMLVPLERLQYTRSLAIRQYLFGKWVRVGFVQESRATTRVALWNTSELFATIARAPLE